MQLLPFPSLNLSWNDVQSVTLLMVQSSKSLLYVQILSSKTAALLSGRLCMYLSLVQLQQHRYRRSEIPESLSE